MMRARRVGFKNQPLRVRGRLQPDYVAIEESRRELQRKINPNAPSPQPVRLYWIEEER